MRSAKELCAMLITRSLKDLTPDEEDLVVDYLEDIGIETELDTKPKDLCLMLLDKTMEKDLGRRVPLTAYANSLLNEKVVEKKVVDTDERKKETRMLQEKSRNLPGCIVSDLDILSKGLYDLQVDPDLGIMQMSDGTSQYGSVLSLSERLYSEIFLNYENPILEINTSKGERGYARIVEPHNGPDNLVRVSPLVSAILNFKDKEAAFLKLCMYLPEISKVGFTFFGNRSELESILPLLIEKVPSVVNAFSYLSLGMVLNTEINGQKVEIRVDKLEDVDEKPIFAGLIAFGESDLPFEIEADL